MSLYLQDKTNNVINLYKDILRAVEDLTTCSYTSEVFSELLARIQAAVTYHSLCLPLNLTDSLSFFSRLIVGTWKVMQISTIG